MINDLVLYEVRDRIGYISLNRSEKRNALNPELVKRLGEIIDQAENDSTCKIIVLEGKGDAFCAGADLAYISQLQNYTEEENLNDSKNLMQLFLKMHHATKLIIGKVTGPALAGGCGLAGLCDLVFASPTATFGYSEARIGFIPAMVMVFLLRKINGKTARELLLTAEIINAEKALQCNLINGIWSNESIHDEIHQYAMKLALTTSSQSISSIKKMLNEIPEMELHEALEYAAKMNVKARTSEDCKAGIQAFLNKQKHSW